MHRQLLIAETAAMPPNGYGGNCAFQACFVVNIVPRNYADEYRYLGSKSGRAADKFIEKNIAWENGINVNAPVISACPVNIECTVVDSIITGSHEMFIGRVEYVHALQYCIKEDGFIDFSKIELV